MKLDEFLTDDRPDAYERLVERLLASPRFGERMASMWLPLARYAEDQAHQVGDDTKFFYPNAHHVSRVGDRRVQSRLAVRPVPSSCNSRRTASSGGARRILRRSASLGSGRSITIGIASK